MGAENCKEKVEIAALESVRGRLRALMCKCWVCMEVQTLSRWP